MGFVLCIPVFNAGELAQKLMERVRKQTSQPDSILVVDSSSSDGSDQVFKRAGARVITIPKNEFNHGKTRNKFFQLESSEIFLFLTQDAIPADAYCFENILKILKDDPEVGLCFGRQLPNSNSNLFAEHARLYNYPAISQKKTLKDVKKLGIKTPFCSNSFAAYRTKAFLDVGGFPSDVILGEDVFVGGKMLEKGWAINYVAESRVLHSHNYSIWEEFKRYFDIGVFYGRESWIKKKFGVAGGEGRKYLVSELRFLKKRKKTYLFPEFLMRNGFKWIGYKLGFCEKYVPINIKKKLSMHSFFWNLRDQK